MPLTQPQTNLAHLVDRATLDAEIITSVNANASIDQAICYMLDEDTSTTLSDTFGNGPDLTLGSTPIWGEQFCGVDEVTAAAGAQYRQTTTNAVLDGLFAFPSGLGSDMLLVMFWVKSDSIHPSAQEYFFSYGATNAGGTSVQFLQQAATNTVFRVESPDGTNNDVAFGTAATLSDDTWHLLTLTVTASAMNIYVDNASGGAEDTKVVSNPTVAIASGRGFTIFAAGGGTSVNFEAGSSTRDVWMGQFTALRMTGTPTNLADLIADTYKRGPGKLSEELKNL